MGRPLLKIGSFFPPLLEQQISPPYRIIARHIEYLQKWREYLLLIWTGDSHTDKNYSVSSQKAVDDLISTILLMDFVRQEEPTAIPSLKETLKTVGNPTAYSLCETIHSQASCQLLKLIFDPNLLISPNIEPRRNVEWFPLARISESIDTLYG